jgi:lipoprotein-releasing system permease protein
MSMSSQLAMRYLAGRRKGFSRLISWISLIGLSLGVMILTVVISVMNGFDAELRTRILGTVPHILVGDTDVASVRQILSDKRSGKASSDDDLLPDSVKGIYRFFVGAGMITRNGAVNPVSVYAVDTAGIDKIDQIAGNMLTGSLQAALREPKGLVMGAPLASHLGLFPGDSVALIVSEPTPSGINPVINRFQLTGTFELGADLDYTLALTHLDSFDQTKLQGWGRSGVRVQLIDALLVNSVAPILIDHFGADNVDTWIDTYGELFDAVRLEKMMMFLILLLVVAIAGFNIVSGQMMVVNEKRSDIAILRTMGATASLIERVFLFQGAMIASIGIVVGLVLGVVVAWNIGALVAALESLVGVRILEGTYFLQIPSEVQGSDLVVVGVLSWGLCLFAAWLPARRAGALNPVAGLRQA